MVRPIFALKKKKKAATVLVHETDAHLVLTLKNRERSGKRGNAFVTGRRRRSKDRHNNATAGLGLSVACCA